jgi:hypothetical protein
MMITESVRDPARARRAALGLRRPGDTCGFLACR